MKFELDEEQQTKLNQWIIEQTKKERTLDLTGYRFQYIFTPSGIIDEVKVVDLQSKEEIDLTPDGPY